MQTFLHSLIVCALSLLFTVAVHAEPCRIQSLSRDNSGSIVDVKGVFSSSFEFSGFKKCNNQKDSWWWLDAPKHYNALMEELKKVPNASGTPRLYVHIKACLSKPGNYGHMGAFPYQLEVIELYDFSSSIPEECLSKDKQQ